MREVLLGLLLALAAARQNGADFSGRWRVDTAATGDIPRVLVVERSTGTSVRGEPIAPAYLWISIRRERASGVTSESRQIGIGGGMVGGVVGRPGEPATRSAARFETVWRDETLQFLDSRLGPDGPHTGDWLERRESWSLEPDGRLRVEVVSEGHDHSQQTTVLLYHREP